MKYLNVSTYWEYKNKPFPKLEASVVFGRNKRDYAFLPIVDGVKMVDAENGMKNLVDDEFRVIKTKAKGTIIIVPGKETSHRVLALVSADAGFRGGCSLVEEDTTARIIAKAAAGSRTDGAVAVAAIMNVGEQVVFYSYGRYGRTVTVYGWDGNELSKQQFAKAEYDAKKQIESAPEGDEL